MNYNPNKYQEPFPPLEQVIEKILSTLRPMLSSDTYNYGLSAKECLAIIYTNTSGRERAIRCSEYTLRNVVAPNVDLQFDALKALQKSAESHLRQGNLEMAYRDFSQMVMEYKPFLTAAHFDTVKAVWDLIEIEKRGQERIKNRDLWLMPFKENLSITDIAPDEIRTKSYYCYMFGEFELAGQILKRNLDSGLEIYETCFELACVLLMQGNYAEAGHYADKARLHCTETSPYVIPCILWLQLVIALLGKQPVAPFIGRLKTLLQARKGYFTARSLDCELYVLKPKLTAGEYTLLKALWMAIKGHDELPVLARFPVWIEAQPQPLE